MNQDLHTLRFEPKKHLSCKPIGGWRMESGGVLHEGDDMDELCDRIIEHRIENRVPIGDVRNEVIDYFCHKNRDIFVTKRVAYNNIEPSDIEQYACNQLPRHSLHFMTTPEISQRVDKCMVCQHRREVEIPDVKHSDSIARNLYQMRRGDSRAEKAGWCDLHKWDNRVECLIERKDITDIGSASKCWACNILTNDKK